eukprot:scaffold3958_cov63-Phaeocystis_antarctica.AAC.3
MRSAQALSTGTERTEELSLRTELFGAGTPRGADGVARWVARPEAVPLPQPCGGSAAAVRSRPVAWITEATGGRLQQVQAIQQIQAALQPRPSHSAAVSGALAQLQRCAGAEAVVEAYCAASAVPAASAASASATSAASAASTPAVPAASAASASATYTSAASAAPAVPATTACAVSTAATACAASAVSAASAASASATASASASASGSAAAPASAASSAAAAAEAATLQRRALTSVIRWHPVARGGAAP